VSLLELPFANKTLERCGCLQCGPRAGRPARACRNPARPAAVAERERAGEGGGGSRVRFGP
jgi:hypothetical protein